MIDVYTADTPNGVKIPIALEEIGAPWRLILLSLAAREQKRPNFLKINPNGRIPAIVDPDGPGGQPLAIFESGAILVYLAEKHGGLLPADPVARIRALAWTFFQVGGVGPMFGQAGFFRRLAEPTPFATQRFLDESQRLVEVLERGLADAPFLAGDELSVADIANFGWLNVAESYAGVTLEASPRLAGWRERLRARPAFQRGLASVRTSPQPAEAPAP